MGKGKRGEPRRPTHISAYATEGGSVPLPNVTYYLIGVGKSSTSLPGWGGCQRWRHIGQVLAMQEATIKIVRL